MNISTFKKLSIVGACALILSACGGGSSGGGEAKARTGYNNINLNSSNLTADITESNYEQLVKDASSIYDLLSTTYYLQDSSKSMFYFLEMKNDQEPGRDWSAFNYSDNPADCSEGSSNFRFANFGKTGKPQNYSKVTMNMSNCRNEEGLNDGSISFTATNLQTASYTSDYNFSLQNGGEIEKLDGSESSDWVDALQKTKYGFNGDFKNDSGKNIVLTVKGSAEFNAERTGDYVRPVSLLLKEDNVQDIKGIGSFQFYTTTKLSFSSGKLYSGTIVAKGKTGEVELLIANGKLEVKLNGNPMGTYESAQQYLGFDDSISE